MTQRQLPDRRIDIPIADIRPRLDREIDEAILHELAQRPATTGYISRRIDEQAGYVSQRLRVLVDQGFLVSLERGFYELSIQVVTESYE